jgi:hypothetical protein
MMTGNVYCAFMRYRAVLCDGSPTSETAFGYDPRECVRCMRLTLSRKKHVAPLDLYDMTVDALDRGFGVAENLKEILVQPGT